MHPSVKKAYGGRYLPAEDGTNEDPAEIALDVYSAVHRVSSLLCGLTDLVIGCIEIVGDGIAAPGMHIVGGPLRDWDDLCACHAGDVLTSTNSASSEHPK